MSYESKTYYSSAQTQIFLNDTLSKEMASIQSQYSSIHVPFFGYRSMHFDTVANSRVQVSGQLIVNYVANSYFTALIYGEKSDIDATGTTKDDVLNPKKAVGSDAVLQNFFTMTNEELRAYREYENQKYNINDNQILKGLRPEMVSPPFDIKVIDNSRFSAVVTEAPVTTDDDIIEQDIDKQIILIKDVFVDSLSRVRSIEQGVIKDAYSFIAKTVI